MNVMGIMQQIMSNNRVMGNPMIKNARQKGVSEGIIVYRRKTPYNPLKARKRA